MLGRTMRSALAAGLGMAFVAGFTASADAQSKIRWKMHSAFGSKLPIAGTGGVRLAETITELSEGRFEVKFYEPGALLPGLPGDVILVDSEAPWRIDADTLPGKAGNTPFDGLPVQGKLLRMWKGGRELV